jgi:hypothetical protein
MKRTPTFQGKALRLEICELTNAQQPNEGLLLEKAYRYGNIGRLRL